MSSDGSSLAIGAINNDDNGNNAGHVKMYKYNNNSYSWTQLGSDIDGDGAYDYFGYSISLSSDGSRVAIGTPYNDNASNAGRVKIYEYNSNNYSWAQLGSDIDGEAYHDSGQSVSLSSDGSRVAIGSINNDDTGNNSGHVRVYEYNNNTGWTQLGSDIDGEAAYDNFGWSVSLSRWFSCCYRCNR